MICEPANQEGASELCQRKIPIFNIREINGKEKCNVVVTLLLQTFGNNTVAKHFGEFQGIHTLELISHFESGISELFHYQPAGCFRLAIPFSG